MNELEALVRLCRTPQLGSIKIRLLLNQFGSAVQACEAKPEDIAFLPGFSDKTISHWKKSKSDGTWADEMQMAEERGVSIVPFTNANYPKRLLELPDYPILLYIKGELKPCDLQSLAVVGTRFATVYGLEQATKISAELSAAGFTIVSGLARGIDVAAHEGALKQGGRTIAVIGSGLANIYPRENIPLAEWMTQQGAIISEFPMMTPPDRQNFPQRNRIVAGMTLGTVLIEAPIPSGALITTDRALAQGRKVFAIPGRIDIETFKGNHSLIKSGKAQLVENGQDIAKSFEELFTLDHTTAKAFKSSLPHLEPEELKLLNQLPTEELSIEEIYRRTNIPISKLNVLMMSLLLKKVIKEYPGKIYKKKSEYNK